MWFAAKHKHQFYLWCSSKLNTQPCLKLPVFLIAAFCVELIRKWHSARGLIIWPIMRSIWENIRTTVLKYGLNEVSSVQKTKVRIFSRIDRTNWSIRALLYSHNQKPTPFLNSYLCIFVPSLTAAVGREILSNFSISFKSKAFIQETQTCLLK